jgi:molecular chaperone DnaK (HSP70)
LIGGDDFDRRLYNDFVAAMRQSDVLDINTTLKDRQRYRLMEAARTLKETLSGQDEDRIYLEAWHNSRDALKEYHRDVFNVLIADKVTAALDVCKRAMKEVPNVKINDVVLVGGSTLIPLVQERVREFFGVQPKSDIDPNLAVIQGVALRAGMYMGRVQGAYLMTRVSDVTIGTEALQMIASLDLESGDLNLPELPEGCYDEALVRGITGLKTRLPEVTNRFQVEQVLRSEGMEFEAIASTQSILYVSKYRVVDAIIKRNDHIEEDGKIKAYTKTFYTSQDDERRILLRLYEIPTRYRSWAKSEDSKQLLKREFTLMKGGPAHANGLVVKLRFDRDGRVEVEYQELLAPTNRDVIVINLIYNADAGMS